MRYSDFNNNYNKSLRTFARENRKDMTRAEIKLWNNLLSKGQLCGFKFRRQRPVLNYIADFMCVELRLIIEVDGITHHHEENFERDSERSISLENAGFKVLRFSDEEVIRDFENVIRTLEAFIESKGGLAI